jgi:hypothetical protein
MVAEAGEVVSPLDLCPPVCAHECQQDDFTNPLAPFIETVQAAQGRLLIGDSAKTQGVVRGDEPTSPPAVGEEGEPRRGGTTRAEETSESSDTEAAEGEGEGEAAGDDEFGGHGPEPTRLVSFFGTGPVAVAAAAPKAGDDEAEADGELAW